MSICEELGLKNELLHRYEAAAVATAAERAAIFTPEAILERCVRMEVSEELKAQVDQFLKLYGNNKAMMGALDLFYYILFESDYEFPYISDSNDMDRPAVPEELDGVFNTIILMAAEVHYQQVIDRTGIDPVHLQNYVKSFKDIKAMTNRVSVYFKYGYAKPYLFSIGRLNYEFRPCVADCRIAKAGDPILTMHIPGGRPLLREDVLASIAEAKKVLGKIFKDKQPKGWLCRSWLMDPQLRQWLPEESNIKKFQDLFEYTDYKEDCTNTNFFEHLFGVKPCPLDELKPRNAFQQQALDHVKNGGHLYVCMGILKDQSMPEE